MGGWGGWTGYAGLPYGAYGYAAYPHGATAVVKTVEVEPAKVEVKALATPAVVAAPAAYTYHHAAPVAYAGYGYAGFPYAAAHVIAKRDAEADADPAYFYNGYAGYPDTDSDTDMPDTHMLDSMELTHMLVLMLLMLMLHLTQPTPISSTPPAWESAPTTLALKF